MSKHLSAALWLAILAAGCRTTGIAVPPPPRLADYLPPHDPARRWHLPADRTLYTPKTLHLYISRDTDRYKRHGFQQMLLVRYHPAGGREPIDVQLYDMGTKLGAFGIFSSERRLRNAPASVGNEAHEGRGFLCFWRGRICVKMQSASVVDTLSGDLRALGSEIAWRIPCDGKLPDLAACFPPRGQIPHTVRYWAENALDRLNFNDSYTARYRASGGEYELLVKACAKPEDATALLNSIRSAADAEGKILRENADTTQQTLEVRMKDIGRAVVIQRDRLVVGAFSLPDGVDVSELLEELAVRAAAATP
jgi:hypothetical protein